LPLLPEKRENVSEILHYFVFPGFHSIHSDGITLTQDDHLAEASETGVVFSNSPLFPGQKFTVHVIEAQLLSWVSFCLFARHSQRGKNK